jgi:hypothetical protein
MVPPPSAGRKILPVMLEIEREKAHRSLRGQGSDTREGLGAQEVTGHGNAELRAAPHGPTQVDNVLEDCGGGGRR